MRKGRQEVSQPVEVNPLVPDKRIVMSALEFKEGTRFRRGGVDSLAVVEWNNLVVAAVHDQDRAKHVTNVVTRGMLQAA